jgi:hypothetical protein
MGLHAAYTVSIQVYRLNPEVSVAWCGMVKGKTSVEFGASNPLRDVGPSSLSAPRILPSRAYLGQPFDAEIPWRRSLSAR